MPIASVVYADASTSRKMTATTFWLSRPWRSYTSSSRRRNGRIRKNMTITYATERAAVVSADFIPVARAIPTTNASMHQAVTSSTAAQVIVTAPTFVLCRLRSVRIRARTGNAVMLIAAPMNSATDVNVIVDVALNTSGYRYSA